MATENKENYTFIAKSDPVQTVQEHTEKLLNIFNKFEKMYKTKFKEEEKELRLIKIACKYHDIGKINSRFQNRIKNNIYDNYKNDEKFDDLYLDSKEIPHGVLSCAFLDYNELNKEFSDNDISVLISAIYNHHNRNININEFNLKEVVDKELAYYCNFYDKNLIPKELCIHMNAILGNGLFSDDIENPYQFWLKFIVVKGMLNKIDYAASAGIDTLELEAQNASKYVEDAFKIKKEKDTNITFPNKVQEFMGKEENKDKNIIVVASTGIGKTEGALLWAGDSKTFYTLPIKVSINAIYKRIWDENYYDKNKFTFLHSDAKSIMRKDEEIDDYQLKYIETRHLIYPLTICTVDQLFYFVFKSLGTEIFPATLKYSKIIIDEIQSYTPDIISFLIFGLKVVNDLGGKFCIMTATLPPIVKYFLEETIGKENIKIAEKPFYKKDNEENIIIRHKIKYEEKDFEYNEILEKAKNNKFLIICNTVRRSQDVYIELKKENKQNIEINLLHSRFIFKERKEKENKIQEFASTKEEKRNNDAGIWISTQIVEASLDIDFDILYTDMCSADSLLQRMGRCYRNRIYKENEPNIFICDTKVGVETVYDKDIFEFSVEHIQEYNNKIFTEEDKQDYINKVYDIEKLKNVDNKNSYYKTIKKNIKDLEILPIGGIDKGTAEEQFRNIQNITVIPRIFYKELNEKNIFQKYEEAFGEDKIDIIDEIMDYTLSAPLYFEKYCIKEIKNKGLENIFISNSKYDKELGLIKELDEKLEFENRCI
ncbi:CRISPR-associated helicase Cas3' [Brachyspira aalborgi]|nr:CRISPR-associated helicase Cas3' [Brachyspira aalborgi]